MLALITSLIVIIQAGQPVAHQLQSARFFYEPERASLLHAVRENMDKAMTLNGHFSQSYVSCGLGCGTYFFVDRRTGGVVSAPEGNPPTVTTWEVAPKRESDVIRVTFGPMDGVGPGCFAQHFSLTGHKFVAVDNGSATRCPKWVCRMAASICGRLLRPIAYIARSANGLLSLRHVEGPCKGVCGSFGDDANRCHAIRSFPIQI